MDAVRYSWRSVWWLMVLVFLATACAEEHEKLTPVADTPPTAVPYPVPTATAVPFRELPTHCQATGDTYQLQMLANDQIFLAETAVSPDGQYFVYQDETGIYLRETNESEQRQLSTQPEYGLPSRLRWSPGGQQLVFVEARPQQYLPVTLTAYSLESSLSATSPIQLFPQVNYASDVGSVSPNNQYIYLFFDGGGSADLPTASAVTIWSIPQQERVYASDGNYFVPRLPVWSPDGNSLAYVRRHNDSWRQGDNTSSGVYTFSLALVNANRGEEISFELPRAAHIDDLVIAWSPDSQAVVLAYLTATEQMLHYYHVDGTNFRLSDGPYWQDSGEYHTLHTIRTIPVSWSMDSQIFYFWEPAVSQDHDKYRLLAWSATQQIATVMLTSTRPPYLSPTAKGRPGFGRVMEDVVDADPISVSEHMALYDQNERISVTVTRLDGTETRPLITGADDAGDPDWSPTGETVAAVWAREKGEGRSVFLSWMNVADGAYFEYTDDDILDIRDLTWSPAGDVLTFLSVHEQGVRVEMLEVSSGQRRILADNLDVVVSPHFSDQEAYFSFRWQRADGTAAYDGYARDGTRLFRVHIDGDITQSSDLFVAPDRQWAAVKVRAAEGEQLQLARLDGTPPLVARSGLGGLGDPLWSPNSQMIGFTQAIGRDPISLHIVDTAGNEIWALPPAPERALALYYATIDWVDCNTLPGARD